MAATIPLQSPVHNRRRRVRHRIQTPAYASFTGESKGVLIDLHEIVDLSEDGVAIQCNSPLEGGHGLNLCLDLAESSGPIYTTAEVMWSQDSGRTGFRFSALPAASLFRVREWLFLNAMAGAANAQSDAWSAPRSASLHPVQRQNYTDTLAALTAVQREVESLGPDLLAAIELIAVRAQTLVRATGAAVALAASDPDFMVCRASSGPDAPPVGAKLHVDSGFSGECVRTGRLLSCHDTETDARVDREGCRALGIRSILAAPVRVGEKVIGILEVFSPHPSAFGPNDSTVMQRLAETVLAAVNRAARSANLTPPAPKPVPFAASPGSVLFASEAGKERDNDLPLEDETHGGIRLPRAHLLVLVCAAATIALVLGYQLAPWIQEKIHAHRSPQTVLASSLPSVNIPAAPAPPTVETATLDQLVQLAETGDAAAQNALGLRYAQGDGVKQNEREAIRWFTKAAEQGNVPAQYKLGLLYWRGDGIPRDTNQAYFWIVLARAGGEVGSKDVAAVLAAGMTHAQAAAIEREAELWFQRHQPMAKSAPDR